MAPSGQLYGELESVHTSIHVAAPVGEIWMVTVDTVPPGSAAVALSAAPVLSGVPASSMMTCGATQSAAATIEFPALTVVPENAPQTLPLAAAMTSSTTPRAEVLARQLIAHVLARLGAPDLA